MLTLFGVLALVVSSRVYILVALVGIGVVVIVALAWLSRQRKA